MASATSQPWQRADAPGLQPDAGGTEVEQGLPACGVALVQRLVAPSRRAVYLLAVLLLRAMILGLASLAVGCGSSQSSEYASPAPKPSSKVFESDAQMLKEAFGLDRASPCREMPAELPSGAQITYLRQDTENRTIHDYGFVTDAECPKRGLLLEAPDCVRLERSTLAFVWTKLRGQQVHQIETRRTDTCDHCGVHLFSIRWPGAECSVGRSFDSTVVESSWDRFKQATDVLDALARVVAKERKRAAGQRTSR